MYQKILVPMALDHGVSPQTIEIARALLGEGGEITALHIHEAAQGSVSVYLDEDVVKEGYTRAKALLETKTEAYPDIKTQIIKGHTARSIIDFANSNDIDCIVIGSHKPGLSDYFLGSTASRVVRHAKCAVHVYRSS
ncbi:universal stress protein [Coralliovum pocilloporae]|uniref:universal stress protein n=1 Tax=Coralliovum pocilloporae TaxID=3066369 RepID=UPI0033071EC9